MTSPAAFLLFLAIVLSFVSVISEQIDDKYNVHTHVRSIEDTIQELVVRETKPNIDMRTINNIFNIFNFKVNDGNDLGYRMKDYEVKQSNFDSVNKYVQVNTDHRGVLNRHLNIGHVHNKLIKGNSRKSFIKKKRVRRQEKTDKCDSFNYEKGRKFLVHPHIGDNDNVNYSSNTYCTTVIRAPEGYVVQLTFIDIFHIEYHQDCSNDFLEVRDGDRGYYNLLGKVCGDKFPSQIITTGPNAWLKFYSDETIEYEGFRIQIDFVQKDTSRFVPESCVTKLSGKYGRLDSKDLNEDCLEEAAYQALDYLWSIDVPRGHKIYLNFTMYAVSEPNECHKNFVQVYGNVLEFDDKIAHYCGSVANPVSTTSGEAGKGTEDADQGNVMHVRLYAAKEQRAKTFIDATFTAFRSLDLSKNNTCDAETEFDCEDNTCIDIALKCNGYANCRLKADEEKDLCKHTTESLIQEPNIQMIVSIFCVIITGISFVFFYKCIKKLYNDHKVIKEQIDRSCDDRLDMLSSRLVLDAKRMQRDSEPRASLERDNHTNEMFKQQRKMQKARPISIDSDFIQENHLNVDEDIWDTKGKATPKTEDVKIELNGKSRRKEEDIEDVRVEYNRAREEDIRKNIYKEERKLESIMREKHELKRIKEDQEYLRKKEELRKKKESEERKQINEFRDVSVSVPDTKQFACQTRDSLFQTEPIRPILDSSSTVKGFSKFRDSGATDRPSLPQIKQSEITFEVIRPTEHEKAPQKRVVDRRPLSAETTRSAPDVIILAKPTAM